MTGNKEVTITFSDEFLDAIRAEYPAAYRSSQAVRMAVSDGLLFRQLVDTLEATVSLDD